MAPRRPHHAPRSCRGEGGGGSRFATAPDVLALRPDVLALWPGARCRLAATPACPWARPPRAYDPEAGRPPPTTRRSPPAPWAIRAGRPGMVLVSEADRPGPRSRHRRSPPPATAAPHEKGPPPPATARPARRRTPALPPERPSRPPPAGRPRSSAGRPRAPHAQLSPVRHRVLPACEPSPTDPQAIPQLFSTTPPDDGRGPQGPEELGGPGEPGGPNEPNRPDGPGGLGGLGGPGGEEAGAGRAGSGRTERERAPDAAPADTARRHAHARPAARTGAFRAGHHPSPYLPVSPRVFSRISPPLPAAVRTGRPARTPARRTAHRVPRAVPPCSGGRGAAAGAARHPLPQPPLRMRRMTPLRPRRGARPAAVGAPPRLEAHSARRRGNLMDVYFCSRWDGRGGGGSPRLLPAVPETDQG